MRLTSSWLLPAIISAASAASDASVYLLESDHTATSNAPTLSPEQARLVFAQRLGASQYHSLKDASSATISYINQFGGYHDGLFDEPRGNMPMELVLIVEGVSAQAEEALAKLLPISKPDFLISGTPSPSANAKLVGDLTKQIGREKKCTIKDYTDMLSECWDSKARIDHYDLSESSNAIADLVAMLKRFKYLADTQATKGMVVLMPKTTGSSKSKASIYGSYEMPSQAALNRRQFEEPMNDDSKSSPVTATKAPKSPSNSTGEPITGVPAICHSTLESCNEKTNGCSGHGKCYKKRGTAGKDACFACGCTAQTETFTHGQGRKGFRITYWGGAACQKKDVSAPFWLISIFTIVLVGLVSWAIGLMYSIGEEKLPGVIGAGVSSNRAR